MACKVQKIKVIQNRLFQVRAKLPVCVAVESIERSDITAIWSTEDDKIAGFFISKAHSILISEITLAILRIFFYLREGKSETNYSG